MKSRKRMVGCEDAGLTLSRLVDILAPWHHVSTVDMAAQAATGLAAWANEKSPKALGAALGALRAWGRYWTSVGPVVDPLSEDGLTRFCATLRQEGFSPGLVLQRLTAIKVICGCIGLIAPEFRRNYQKVRSLYSLRRSRPQPMKPLPLMVADVRRLVDRADPTSPRDVRNVLVMLILYETMASFSELIGPDMAHARLEVGTMLSDVTFEQTGTSLLSLHARRADVPGRTVRLSTDATAWLHHWIGLRGRRPGHLLAFFPPEGSGDRNLAALGRKPLWYGPIQFKRLALRHGINGDRLTASSLRLGRAVALLDAGFSLSYVADAGGWSSALRLAHSLDAGLTMRRQARARREPLRLS